MPRDAANIPGPVGCMIRVTRDGASVAVARMAVMAIDLTGDDILDEGKRVPSLDEVLAAVSRCERAAANAESATKSANAAASSANTAAKKINNMSASAKSVDAGAEATATVTIVDGHYNIAFGVPRGATGPQGAKGDPGSIDNLAENVALEIAKYNFGQPYNLLDNSDFVHPINQRGETSKQASWEYWIDRWISDTEKTAAQLTSSGIHLPATVEKNLRIIQRVPLARIKKGQSYTIAAYDASGNVLCVSGVFNGGILTGDGLSEGKYYLSLQSGDNSTYYYCILDAYADITVKCMALYEGEYTAETLPPYVPKGYAAELAECLRYYRRITATNETFAGYCANGVSYCMIPLQTMRIKPSLVPSGKFHYTLGNKQGTTTATATAHSANVNRAIIKCAITETGILTGTISPQGDIDISADL